MQVEIKDLEGRDAYVVPVVMAVEGVMNGSRGALLYPADDLKKSVPLWNGKPVVVYHPDLYTDGLAAYPAVFNNQKIGTVFNAKFENKKLKAEAWIDPERLEKIDKRILFAIRNRQVVEVSTGLFNDVEEKRGVFNGKNYIGIARNYVPDHLAVLPDLVGACSIDDGCGLVRNIGEVEPLVACAL